MMQWGEVRCPGKQREWKCNSVFHCQRSASLSVSGKCPLLWTWPQHKSSLMHLTPLSGRTPSSGITSEVVMRRSQKDAVFTLARGQQLHPPSVAAMPVPQHHLCPVVTRRLCGNSFTAWFCVLSTAMWSLSLALQSCQILRLFNLV